MEWLRTNFLHFNHVALTGRAASADGFSGQLYRREAMELLWDICAMWNIGPSRPEPRPAHFSASYFSTSLLRRAKARFGRVFVKPLGDVSLLALAGLTDACHYLDLPLSYIGEHDGQITRAGQPGQRQRLRKSVWLRGYAIRHSPLHHGLSYDNLGVDCLLDVLSRLGLLSDRRARLRPDFFRKHLRAVLSDRPWTRETWRDLAEVMPHVLSLAGLCETVWKRGRQAAKLVLHPATVLRNRLHPRVSAADLVPARQFPNCLEFAEWAGQRFLPT
jgi:hypothetical protein